MTPKRPISVWISQIILGLYAFGVLVIVLWGLYRGLTKGIPNPELYIFSTIGILALAAVFFGGFLGLTIRKRWGRWLGLVGLGILLIGTVAKQTSQFLSDASGETSIFSISFLFSVSLVLGLASLVYLIAFGDAAEAFFKDR